MVEKLASVDEDVRSARRRDMTQENGGVAPSVPVPRLYCLDANLRTGHDKQTANITPTTVRKENQSEPTGG